MAPPFDDGNLIFLLSQPRAGSTLLQRILAAHPEIHTTAETWLMLHPVYALRDVGHRAEYDASLAFRATREFCTSLEDGLTHYDEAIRRMAFHLYGTACAEAGSAFFLDKTPRYYLIIPELARVFPEARFIILVRNPTAVLASILSTWVKGHWMLLARYRNDLLVAPRLLRDGIELLQDRATVLRYEDLVRDPHAHVSTLCDFLGMDFDPAMVDYGRSPKPAGSLGDTTGVDNHQRPSTVSVDRWLELADGAQTHHLASSYLEAMGPDLLGDLGYGYGELTAQLGDAPPGRLEISWPELFPPDGSRPERLDTTELAFLTYRRAVHAARSILRKVLGGRR